MSILGDNVMQEILFRLSAIEISCCKAVCKPWRSLISSADFVSAHLQRSKSDPSTHFLLVHDDLPRPRFLSDTPKPGICCYYSVVGSVNGLICLVGIRSDSGIFIVNPVTGLSLRLPSPSDAGCKFAFWCDDAGGVYKLAKIYFQLDAPSKVEVWDSSFPDQWTQVVTAPDFRFHMTEWESGPGVLVEGVAAYWILTDRDGDAFVVWLDFKTLLLDSIPLSKRQSSVMSTDDWREIRGVGESYLFGANFKGKFALVQNSYVGERTYHIWTMAMDANGSGRVGWKKTCTIRIDFPFLRCLGSANGKLVLMSVSNGITLFDVETGVKQSEKEDVFGEQFSRTAPETAHDFVGSLVWIEGFEFNDKLRSLKVSWPYSYTWGRVRKIQQPLLLPKSRPPPPPPPPPPRAPSHMYRLLHQQMQMHHLTGMPPPPPPSPPSHRYSKLLHRKFGQALFGPHPSPTARISSPPPEWWPPRQPTRGPHPMQFMFMHPPPPLPY